MHPPPPHPQIDFVFWVSLHDIIVIIIESVDGTDTPILYIVHYIVYYV